VRKDFGSGVADSLEVMRRQIPGKERAASDSHKNACPCAEFPIGRIAIETKGSNPAGGRTELGSGGFGYRVKHCHRPDRQDLFLENYVALNEVAKLFRWPRLHKVWKV
jgi:hypothetical protein